MGIKLVKSFTEQTAYVGKITHGKDILESLEAFCVEHEIKMAWVSLLGALSEVTLAYYTQDTHQYVTKTFTGEFEIVNGTGNISLKDGVPVGHIHLTLSNTEYGCIAGHLIKGSSKVFACEFNLTALGGSEPLFRGSPDEETGLPLWIY